MTTENHFEQIYLALREREQRIYDDRQLMLLPEINSTHPHHKEWQIRKESCLRLINYLHKKQKPLKILEIGCGNGWLCAQLAKALPSKVTGIDINKVELEQAKRVFSNLNNLEFIYGEIDHLQNKKFDTIIFASSIQYFHSLKTTLGDLQPHLETNGEIHILDSHFYNSFEIPEARQRTKTYFQNLGFPIASNYYFHHDIEEMKSFDNKILYNPNSFLNKLKQNKNPFYWIRISTNHKN